ncbi:MAG: LPS assembly protein LptD [Thermodesulforhabdaceae bacterium]
MTLMRKIPKLRVIGGRDEFPIRPYSIFGFLIFSFLFWGSQVFSGVSPSELPTPRDFHRDNLPWTLTADKIEYLKDEDAYKAEGRVVLQSGPRRIEADKGIFYKKEGLVKLESNVLLSYGEDWIRGDLVVWNLERQTGYVEHGKAYFAKNHFYVEAERIERLEGNEYTLDRGFVTTCTPVSPDWSIHYRHLYIPSDGMAKARNVVFQVGSVPVIFIPWVVVPVNTERHSGILRPVLGFSDLNGFMLEVPYYWAIDHNQDATFFGQMLQKRGFMGGVEYRWNDARWGEGIFLANYLHDLADTESVRAHGFSLDERDRYWIRGTALTDLPYDIKARLKLDMVSDRDFLNEFTRGSPSFEYTNSELRSFLGTELITDKSRTARESNAYFFKKGEDTDVSFNLHYFDENDPLLKDVTLQELPSFAFSIGSSPFSGLPLYYSVRSSIAQYWRDEGTRGTKIYAAPEISMSESIGSILNTKTTITLHNVLYKTDGDNDDSKGLDGRTVPVFATGANVKLERSYALDIWGIPSVTHTVSPEIAYEYAPKVNEKSVPSFDESKSIFYTNRIRYGIQSFLTANKNNSSEEWGRVNIFQYYRIGNQKVPFFENGLSSPFEKGEGFSDVYLDVEFTPHRYVDLSYTMAAAPEVPSVRQHDVLLSIQTFTGQRLGMEYRYRENTSVDELIAYLNWDVRPWLSLGTYHDYSFARHDMFKHGYSVTYRRDCWALSVSYELEGEDRRFFVSINLLGLGQAGVVGR